MAETHQEVVKVWIAPGCIVCDACETDCPEVFGDELERPVSWGAADLDKLSGRPVRLRFALRDADLFSFQFSE